MLQPDPLFPQLMWDKPYHPTYFSPLLGCEIQRWILSQRDQGLGLVTISTWSALIVSSQSATAELHQRMLLWEFNSHLAPMQ